MKFLILLLLILLSSCSHDHPHEHPLADHGHEHTHDHSHDLEHEHYSAFNLGLPFAYIMRVDPPPTQWGIPPIGVLTKRIGEGEYEHERVDFQFSRYPENFRVRDLDLPWLNITPVDGGGLSGGTINIVRVFTDCHDPDHTGYLAFRLSWDNGFADFVYKCPEED